VAIQTLAMVLGRNGAGTPLNSAQTVVEARVPAQTTMYAGYRAPQERELGGTLLDGGTQIYIPRGDPSWIVGSEGP
jgi:hypothetical protein